MSNSDEPVEVVDYSDGMLGFKAEPGLELSKKTVCLESPRGYVYTDVDVQSFDEENQVYRASVGKAESVLPFFNVERRAAERVTCAITVTSPDLTGECHTEDLSVTGARLSLHQPLSQGGKVKLTYEFQSFRLPALCEVRWCGKKSDDTYQAGVRFLELEPKLKSFIADYVRLLK
ncbi:MAG: PilZ domain-containing protein [Vulcanimicrobiota bacterium]